MSGHWRAVAFVLSCVALPGGHARGAEVASGSRVCDTATGWHICVEIPEGGNPDRASPFTLIAYADGPGYQFAPWAHWSGSDWEGLIIKLLPRDRAPTARDDRTLRDWAGFWDADRRAKEIAGGQSRLSTPLPFKVSTYVDGKGRRWPHAVRHTRMLRPWIVRTEHVLAMPLDQDGMRLLLQFDCTSTTGNCRRLDAIVSSLTWESRPTVAAGQPPQPGNALPRDDGPGLKDPE